MAYFNETSENTFVLRATQSIFWHLHGGKTANTSSPGNDGYGYETFNVKQCV